MHGLCLITCKRLLNKLITLCLLILHSFLSGHKYLLKCLIYAYIGNLETADKEEKPKTRQLPTIQNDVHLLVFCFPIIFFLHIDSSGILLVGLFAAIGQAK